MEIQMIQFSVLYNVLVDYWQAKTQRKYIITIQYMHYTSCIYSTYTAYTVYIMYMYSIYIMYTVHIQYIQYMHPVYTVYVQYTY